VTYIAGLRSPGITSTGRLISQCLVISRKKYNNINTFNQNVPKCARTHRHQSNLRWKHKLHFHLTFPPASTKRASVMYNASWGAFFIMLVDMTVLVALSTIASEQTAATEQTLERCTQLLDNLASNSEAKVQYYTSDMVINIPLYASYLSEAKARSRTCGHFFMGWIPKNGEPIKLNGVFHFDSLILHFVAASTAKARNLGRSSIIANPALFFEASWKT
jgi:hypothetical protein